MCVRIGPETIAKDRFYAGYTGGYMEWMKNDIQNMDISWPRTNFRSKYLEQFQSLLEEMVKHEYELLRKQEEDCHTIKSIIRP